jgi:hypothetical protein
MYTPKFPYDKDQIIINSNRITLNSKDDSIFLFANKIINFSSNEGIHFNTNKNIIFNSSKIQLGLNAEEPLVKGNQLKNILEKLLELLEIVGSQLLTATDSNNIPIVTVQTSGNSLIKSSKRIKLLLKNLNSEQNYTL